MDCDRALHERRNFAAKRALNVVNKTAARVESGQIKWRRRSENIIMNQALENRVQAAERKTGVKEGDAGVCAGRCC